MAEIKVPVVRNILQANERLAAANRKRFDDAGIFVFNLMSSPGAGKTSLLEKTVDGLADRIKMAVIEGDLQCSFDAERIQRKGVQAIQINTDGGCHLDGNMIQIALESLNLNDLDLLIIENVGNLVCPALFDLGESSRVVIMSVTEGEDKPLKYPNMFQTSHLCLINKSDLLPYLDFDLERFREYASRINKNLEFITISAKTGEGFEEWYSWLDKKVIC